MKYSEYQELYRKLCTAEDIDFLAENFGYDKELLLVIYTQRVVRDATKRFYKVKRQAKRLHGLWRRGTSLVALAQDHDFPPVLLALMVLEQDGVSRKQFWRYLHEPASVPDRRLRKEITQVLARDIIYSPEGTAKQYARGRWGEEKLEAWLDDQSVDYRTEKQLRKEYAKTPDALLERPLELNGSKLHWIESKATFGDPYEIRRHVRKQLKPYVDLFGEGMVVYWFGYVEDVDVDVPEGVAVVDGEFFEGPGGDA
jgi:hypothetical protein